MKLGELLASKGFVITASMSLPMLVKTWDKLPIAVKRKYAPVTAALVAAGTALAALRTARAAYEVAHTTYKTAEHAMDVVVQSMTGPQGQAVVSAEASSLAQESAATIAESSVTVAKESVTATILNTEVSPDDEDLFREA